MISNIEASGEIQKGKNIWNIDLITLVFLMFENIFEWSKFKIEIKIEYSTENIRKF